MIHPRAPLLVVLSGPSGVGKDAIIARLKEVGRPYHFVVTATTRPPRPGETHGVDYFFLDEAEFASLLAAGGLIEHATVYGGSYGVPRAQIEEALASGRDVIMRVDVQGARTVRRLAPGALLIFVAPASPADLERRLFARDGEDAASLRRRLAAAEGEMRDAELFDYVVVNEQDRLDEAVGTVEAIITAEHARVKPRGAPLSAPVQESSG